MLIRSLTLHLFENHQYDYFLYTLFFNLPNIILYLWIAGLNNRNTLCSDLWDLPMMFYYNMSFCFLTFENIW